MQRMRRHRRKSLGRSAATASAVIASAVLILLAGNARAALLYSDFDSPASLATVGDASFGSGIATLTSNAANQTGAIWHQTPQTLADGFTTSFEFNIHSIVGAGGSGIAFVVQNSLDTTSAIGLTSAGLGYEGIPVSLAVEFDTGLSGGGNQGDPNGNHVAVQSDGVDPNNRNHLTTSPARIGVSPFNLPVTFADELTHSVRIDYLPGLMEIWVDGNYIMGANVDLTDIGGENILDGSGNAYVGFTSSTGAGSRHQHDLLSWSLGSLTGASVSTTSGAGADSHIRRGNAAQQNTNYGNEVFIRVKNQDVSGGGPNARKGYVRFDMSTLSTDLSDVTRAALEFTVSPTTAGTCSVDCLATDFVFQVYGLNDGHNGENWIEGNGGDDNDPAGELDWLGAPAHDVDSGNGILPGETTLLGTMTVPGNGVAGESVSFSSDALLQFLLDDTDGQVSLIVTRVLAQGDLEGVVGTIVHHFNSKEGSTAGAPTLHLTVVPEPSTMGLLIVGAIGGCVRRRR